MKQQAFSLPFILDGATGTELAKRGMQPGDCTERFILDHPAVLTALQSEYIAAGASAVLAPTFGANRTTLQRHGYGAEEVEPMCRALFRIAKDNAGEAKVGGDLSPTGLLLKPYGNAEPEEVEAIYREQAAALLACGVDFFFIETMLSAAEARLAVRAVRSLSQEIPVLVSLTVKENGRTMNGDVPGAALLTLLPYEIQGFGCNCSIGPEVVAQALRSAAPIAKAYDIPLIAKPNAGMPVTDAQGTHFPLTPEDMAEAVESFTAQGVGIFGGCCGTTPAHIAAIATAARATSVQRFSAVEAVDPTASYVATARVWAKVDPAASYTEINGDSEGELYDLMEECDPEDVLYLKLAPGAAELLIEMDAFIPNPIAVCGEEQEIEAVEKALCRKVR